MLGASTATERFFRSLKMERVYRQVYVNREKVIRDVTDYVVNSYKSRRLFSKLGYLSPNGYEQKWQKKNLPVSEKT